MNRPEIYRYAAEYGAGEFKVAPSEKEFWLAYYIDGRMVGLSSLYVITGSACQAHPYILRDYSHYYEDMLKAIFAWFVEYMPPEAIKLNALIPTMFKRTIQAVKNVGGQVEGLDRMSYRRTKTRVYDRMLLGITREEMEQCLN
jgi:hypothetical protein